MKDAITISKDKIKIIAVIIAGIIVGILISSFIFSSDNETVTTQTTTADSTVTEETDATEATEETTLTSAVASTSEAVPEHNYQPSRPDREENHDRNDRPKEDENTQGSYVIQESYGSYEMREANFEAKTSSGVLYTTNKVIYPHFYGNSSAERVINEKYAELISTYSKRSVSDIDSWYNANSNKATLPYYKNITVKITYSSDEYISLVETISEFTGGGRPYNDVKGYTYSIYDGRELSYREFFKGDNSFIDGVLDKAFLSATGESKAPENWYDKCEFILTDKGISFYYNVGDSVAREEISVSYGDMEDASVKNTTVKNTAKAESNDLRQLLIDNEWYNAIQTEHTYHFYDDGSAVENTRVFNYTLEGDTLTFYWENGYVSTMKYVTKGDDYNWQEDGSFYRIYETMPEGEKFFYDTSFVWSGTPGSGNAMWIRMK